MGAKALLLDCIDYASRLLILLEPRRVLDTAPTDNARSVRFEIRARRREWVG